MAFYPPSEPLMSYTGGLANRDIHRSVSYSNTGKPTLTGYVVCSCLGRWDREISSHGKQILGLIRIMLNVPVDRDLGIRNSLQLLFEWLPNNSFPVRNSNAQSNLYCISYIHCRHCWSNQSAGRVSNVNLVYGITFRESLLSSVERTCEGNLVPRERTLGTRLARRMFGRL